MRNAKPEKQIEALFKVFAHKIGWSLDVIESKAQFSPAAGTYRKSQAAPEGFSDMVGISHDNTPVYIELKAKGKRNTLREEQARFLATKVCFGAFAIVTDDPEHCKLVWNQWEDSGRSKLFLLNLLNIKKYLDQWAKSLCLKDKALEGEIRAFILSASDSRAQQL